MTRNSWKIGILALLPIAWDLTALHNWILRGYHAIGGLLIRLYVPLAMPQFSSALRWTRLPRVTEPSLETHRYRPHPPHLHFAASWFAPHTSLGGTLLFLLGWTVLEWCFVMGLLRWGTQVPLASLGVRVRALPIFFGINLGILALRSIPTVIQDPLAIRLLVGVLLPGLVIGMQYFLIFFKFDLLTTESNLRQQWQQSQLHRHRRSSFVTGWLIAMVAIGFLSALVANLGTGTLWAVSWTVVIDGVDVWLLLVLAGNFEAATKGMASTMSIAAQSSSPVTRP